MNSPSDLADRRPSVTPAVIGFLLAGLLLLAIGLWTSQRQTGPSATPVVTLIQPAADTSVTGPLTLTFRTQPGIRPGPGGWRTRQYHLHALLDTTELMPAAGDIRDLGDQTYRWTLPAFTDSARVQLVWALPNHRRLPEGASATILVRTLP